jgi:hypothetical protein
LRWSLLLLSPPLAGGGAALGTLRQAGPGKRPASSVEGLLRETVNNG